MAPAGLGDTRPTRKHAPLNPDPSVRGGGQFQLQRTKPDFSYLRQTLQQDNGPNPHVSFSNFCSSCRSRDGKAREAFSGKSQVEFRLCANRPNPCSLSLPAHPGRQPPMLYCPHSISQLMAQHVNTKESAGHTKHIITAHPPITHPGPLLSHLLLQTVRLRPAGNGGF